MMKKILIFACIALFGFSCATMKTLQNISVDYYNIGNEYFTLKDYRKAVEFYEKSIEYDPNSTKSVLNLIISYQMNNNHAKAETVILKYYKPENNDYNKKLLILLANNYFYLQNYDKAIKTYKIYTENYPNEPQGYFNIGLTYLKKSDKKSAVEHFRSAYDKDNKFLPAIFNLVDYYKTEKDYENCLFFSKILTELDKSNPEVFYGIAELEYKKEDFESARDYINEAIKLDKENPEYYILLAKAYSKGYKDKAKTLENIENALKNKYKNIMSLQGEEEFKLLKEYPEFKKLLEKYSGKKNKTTTEEEEE